MLTQLATLAITATTVKNRVILVILCLLAAAPSSPSAHARLGGREVDNGGDSLVYNFREKGRRVLSYLKTTSPGLHLANAYGLSLERLEATLAPGNITSVLERTAQEFPRFDSNPLDTPVSPIVLVRMEWSEPRAKLVFHAMLVAAGYDDRNGEISGDLPESHLTD